MLPVSYKKTTIHLKNHMCPSTPHPPKFNVDQKGNAKRSVKKTPILVQNIRVSEFSTLNWGVRGLSECKISFGYGCFFVTNRKEVKSTLGTVWGPLCTNLH